MEIKHIKQASDIYVTKPSVLVLGYFDALHKGHKALFDKAKEVSAQHDLEISVLTFYESPQLAFERFHPDLLCHLTYPEKRYQLFEDYGVDHLYLTDFTAQFAKQTANGFVSEYIERFQPHTIIVGFDYHFSCQRSDSNDLSSLVNAEVITISEITSRGEKISSTRIRQLISEGKVKEAGELLGYHYSSRGIVVHGDARGRTMGFPTANLALIDRTFIPAYGVYVTDVLVGGKTYRAMTSVGENITFGGEELRIEAHIFNFNGDIYGETIEIFWRDYIRPMVKFASMEELGNRLQKDKEIAINWRKSIEF
ncbi:bifunctional riboflavin kinase/FAD synthetase [Streptococcus fryi]